jgi:E3 Ubiquitin ligase
MDFASLMFEDIPIIFGVVLVLIGLVGFFIGSILFRKKRLIENTPTAKIRSIAMGLIEISGQVIPIKERIFKSPFTDRECVYYKFTVEEYRSSGKNSNWVTIKNGEQRNLFYLKDDTERILVDPTSATIEARIDFEYQSGLGKDPPEQVIRFLAANNLAHEGFFGLNKTMRYRETIIVPDDTLYIMGTAGENPFNKEATANHVDSIMIQKGKYEKQYYISDKSEKQILKNLAILTYGMWALGIILIIVGAILFF